MIQARKDKTTPEKTNPPKNVFIKIPILTSPKELQPVKLKIESIQTYQATIDKNYFKKVEYLYSREKHLQINPKKVQ
ncbi:hypothetical protein OQX62_21620 [Pedobacter sp. MR2016-24]|nr:hypothetical protein [Pedobacter sp. MR2016-24]